MLTASCPVGGTRRPNGVNPPQCPPEGPAEARRRAIPEPRRSHAGGAGWQEVAQSREPRDPGRGRSLTVWTTAPPRPGTSPLLFEEGAILTRLDRGGGRHPSFYPFSVLYI